MNANFSLKHSEQINEIASALAKAQGEMKPAVFNRVNPHYKSRYADFTSCMDACRAPLSKNGLAVTQLPSFSADGKFILSTLLLHSSGQWMSCEFPMSTKTDNIQAIGSAMSYAKRYSLCGMLGIVADEDIDDDGNHAVVQSNQNSGSVAKPAPQPNPNSYVNPQPEKVNGTPRPNPSRINTDQVTFMKSVESKLSADYKKKIYDWIEKQYGYTTIEALTVDIYPKILEAFVNASKLMEAPQQQRELAHA